MSGKLRSNRQLWRWLAVAIWAMTIFGLSSIPGSMLKPIPTFFGWDKIAHAVLYGVLGILLLRAFELKRLSPWLILLFCVVYGLTDELHQYWVPGRQVDIFDLTADIFGSAVGVFLWVRHETGRSADGGPKDNSGSDNTIG